MSDVSKDYIAWSHGNLNVDNVFFWRTSEGATGRTSVKVRSLAVTKRRVTSVLISANSPTPSRVIAGSSVVDQGSVGPYHVSPKHRYCALRAALFNQCHLTHDEPPPELTNKARAREAGLKP